MGSLHFLGTVNSSGFAIPGFVVVAGQAEAGSHSQRKLKPRRRIEGRSYKGYAAPAFTAFGSLPMVFPFGLPIWPSAKGRTGPKVE